MPLYLIFSTCCGTFIGIGAQNRFYRKQKNSNSRRKLHICLPESINMKKVYGVCKADICSSAGAEEEE